MKDQSIFDAVSRRYKAKTPEMTGTDVKYLPTGGAIYESIDPDETSNIQMPGDEDEDEQDNERMDLAPDRDEEDVMSSVNLSPAEKALLLRQMGSSKFKPEDNS